MTRHDEIIDFLERRWQDDAKFTKENCYYFAVVLKARFPWLDVYYEPVDGHFVAGDGEHFYDWVSEYTEGSPILFDEIQEADHAWYECIVRDCIK